MLPVYQPGDHVLTFNWINLKIGDVVVFKVNNFFYLKRVKKIEKDLVHVSGDNKRESEKIAPVKRTQIIGRVVLNY